MFFGVEMVIQGTCINSFVMVELQYPYTKGCKIMTNREVINRILADDPSLGEEEANTVDTFKYGDPDATCTGAGCCITVTPEAIELAAELGCSLLITHEPTFYNHEDNTTWLDGNQVYAQKTALLDKHGIAVWRYHDHMHRHQPDKIFHGIAKELGWEGYYKGMDFEKGICARYSLPKTTPLAVAGYLKEKIGIESIRAIGNIRAEISEVAFMFHVFGGESDAQRPDGFFVSNMEAEGIELAIPGELIDWTLASYIRDAGQLGFNKAILSMGHFNMESLGMKHMPSWLNRLVEIPVHYIDTGDIYQHI